ncbi:MAG: hypothetical protein ABSC94_09535 [Polyangiaceae bacterium]
MACGRSKVSAFRSAPLAGVVARAGDVQIPAALVAAVAEARGITSARALDAVIDDALLATGARVRGLDQRPDVAWATSAALAARMSDALVSDARRRGAPSDDELSMITVVHAVILRSPGVSEERGRAIADTIRQAVVGAPGADGFEQRALAVPHVGVHLVVEKVGPFGADGVTSQGTAIDPTFVSVALALRSPGDTSAVAETPFGWHVIRLVVRSAQPDASDARRRSMEDAVLGLRVRQELQVLLAARRNRARVEIANGAESILAAAAVRGPS